MATILSIRDLVQNGVVGGSYTIRGTIQPTPPHTEGDDLRVLDGSTAKTLIVADGSKTTTLQPWDTVEICGTLVSQEPATLQLSNHRVYGQSDGDNPLNHGKTAILQHPHLRLRLSWHALLMRFRSATMAAISDYFNNHPDGPFHQVHHPIITHTDCEGGAEVFPVLTQSGKNAAALQNADFFGGRRYLSVTAAIHGEAFTMGLDRVWMLTPSFRAERVDDNRHLAEFYMLEISMNHIESLEVLLDLCQSFTKGLVERLRDSFAGKELLENVGRQETTDITASELEHRWQLLCEPNWPRLSHAEATTIMLEAEREGDVKFEVTPGPETDFSQEHEAYLLEHFKRPVFVTHYPTKIRLFSALQSPPPTGDAPQTTESIDLLLPGIAEVFSGGLREHRLEKLIQVMRSKNFFSKCQAAEGLTEGGKYPYLKEDESLDSLKWFADMRRWSTTPHGGIGFGFERLLVYLTGARATKDVIAFPRYYQGCYA